MNPAPVPARKHVLAVLASAVLCLAVCRGAEALAAAPGNQPALVPMDFTSLAEQASPAVVNIRTVKASSGRLRDFFEGPWGREDPFHDFFDRFFGDQFPREYRTRSLGSGFIMDPDGYIVTNHHVIKGAESISVKLNNGKEYEAELVGADSKTDLALLKVDAGGLPFLPLGDSEKLKVGQWVVAIGSPFGLEHTVTAGIVSAKGRVIGAGPYDDFIQTDASINPGNSGGPLLDLSGKVVGINTAIVAHGQGIGFAIPINLASDILTQLRETGSVTRGWLGVAIQDVTPAIAEYYGAPDEKGALVSRVFPGDPADQAGIKPMDIIRKVNGKPVESSRDLSRVIAGISAGDRVTVTVFRDGKIIDVPVTIVRRDDEALPPGVEDEGPLEPETETFFGMALTPLDPRKADRLGVPDSQGLLVMDVTPDGPADKAGLLRGDVITEVDRVPVTTLEQFRKLTKDKDTVSLFVHQRIGAWAVVKLEK
ncbi:MAG: DegQ family serine endoprotease [Deltaproteobacteria bacterium]|nr:DegQ family serine endoprotease [Deltaproteobacteria bacterium]